MTTKKFFIIIFWAWLGMMSPMSGMDVALRGGEPVQNVNGGGTL